MEEKKEAKRAFEAAQLATVWMSREHVQKTMDTLRFTPEAIKNFCERPYSYLYGDWENDPDLVSGVMKFMTRKQLQPIFHGLAGALENIRVVRKHQKSRESESVINHHKRLSKNLCESIIRDTFRSIELDRVTSSSNTYDYLSCNKTFRRFSWSVTVPITWYRNVFLKDISRVDAGDGPRVILRAVKRDIKRLTDEGIEVYKVVSLKHRKNTAEVLGEWVFKQTIGDSMVTACHADFKRGEALLNRRIKKAVTDELLG